MGSTIIPSSKYPTPYPGQSSGVGTFFPSGTIAPSSTLLNDLVSYWPLNEESGVRADVVGPNDLTDNNTVGFAAGMDGNAASFVAANSEWLTKMDGTFDSADQTAAIWYKSSDPTADFNFPISIGDGWSETSRLAIFQYGNHMNARVGYTSAYREAISTETTDANWHLLIAWFDSSDSKVRISIDNGTAVASVAITGSLLSSTKIGIGVDPILLSSTYAWDGQLDEAALWSRVLTEDERTELYNAGAGKFYPFT